MVYFRKKLACYELFHFAQIYDVPRFLVDGTLNGHVEDVIMPMPVRIVALSEGGFIFGVGERRVIDAVRGVEPQASCDGDFAHLHAGEAKTPPSLFSGGGA